jgi:hypothetical protein
MSRKYSVTHETAAGSTLTILALVNPGTAARGWVYDMIVGSDATPADLAGQFDVIRGTVSGTGTSVTARPLDPANPAGTIAPEGGTFTGQTKTANSAMLSVGLNQRATFRWVAAPGGELVIPATADNWVGLESINHGGTPNINCTFMYEE